MVAVVRGGARERRVGVGMRGVGAGLVGGIACTTSGHRKTSCRYFVNMNGIRWPRCRDSEDGPRPVYKYMGFPAAKVSRIMFRSRCEKKMPRCKKKRRCRGHLTSDRRGQSRHAVIGSEPLSTDVLLFP